MAPVSPLLRWFARKRGEGGREAAFPRESGCKGVNGNPPFSLQDTPLSCPGAGRLFHQRISREHPGQEPRSALGRHHPRGGAGRGGRCSRPGNPREAAGRARACPCPSVCSPRSPVPVPSSCRCCERRPNSKRMHGKVCLKLAMFSVSAFLDCFLGRQALVLVALFR